MKLRLIRRVALGLIALLAFAQASVALAACSMERGGMAQMLTVGDGCGCVSDEVKMSAPQDANRCIAHCTADLQLSGVAAALVRGPADAPVLLVPRVEPSFLSLPRFEGPLPAAVPRRILLHSFLI